MFLCIIAFVGDGLTIHMDSSNTNDFDLKLYLNRFQTFNDTPPSSLMELIASPKVKIVEGEEVGVRSLVQNTLGVEGRAGAPIWDQED